MKKPTTVKTFSRIFKITNFDGDTFLCNLDHLKVENLKDIKYLWHLWNFKFERFGKDQLKSMILNK